MACLMDLMKIDGRIVTIDSNLYQKPVYPKTDLVNIDGKIITVNGNLFPTPDHPKIEYIRSDCLITDIPKRGSRTMLILDCDHNATHVYKELEKYSSMVTLGQYIIVEDTDAPDKNSGPAAAVKRFLSKNKNFMVDKSREKYGVSSNLGGYLLRIS